MNADANELISQEKEIVQFLKEEWILWWLVNVVLFIFITKRQEKKSKSNAPQKTISSLPAWNVIYRYFSTTMDFVTFDLELKFMYTANVLSAEITDECLQTKSKAVMKILGIAYPKHWILLVVSKYLDEHLMQINLLVLSNWIYFWLSIICFA